MSDAYDRIDRFLRNNLDDDAYAEYSAALDEVAQAQDIERLKADNNRLQTAVTDWLYANGPDGWIERLRKDAERYRWLRHPDNDPPMSGENGAFMELPAGKDLDASIDAAMDKLA